ncbi:MAG TPA: hypothetical protein VHB98_20505 [Chloroflexota bacterium]|jgi:hypothetical protein|nr:hypothetical protein [Chloroflexota bacterium]
MSGQHAAIRRILTRMLEASEEHVDTQVTAVQRVARELSLLSATYHGHLVRAGMQRSQLAALEERLETASTSLSRTHFDLQQRLFGDVQALHYLMENTEAPEQAEDVPSDTIRAGLDAYCADLEREHHSIGETLGGLALQLRLLANNIEIAASHAGGEDVLMPVDLFCTMSGLLRGLANRLRSATDDLQIFEQTQNGHAESLRMVLTGGAEGTAA